MIIFASNIHYTNRGYYHHSFIFINCETRTFKFMLIEGVKKWYMCSSDGLEADTDTHPGFYREKSTHKCIQKSGEVLYVPTEWYHEIFNISEYTAGIQALPS